MCQKGKPYHDRALDHGLVQYLLAAISRPTAVLIASRHRKARCPAGPAFMVAFLLVGISPLLLDSGRSKRYGCNTRQKGVLQHACGRWPRERASYDSRHCHDGEAARLALMPAPDAGEVALPRSTDCKVGKLDGDEGKEKGKHERWKTEMELGKRRTNNLLHLGNGRARQSVFKSSELAIGTGVLLAR